MAKRLFPVTLAVNIAVWLIGGIEPAGAQSLSAFGPPPSSRVSLDIRPVRKVEVPVIESTRVCNITVPLIGGGELINADEAALRDSIAHYAEWEQSYQMARSFSSAVPLPTGDLGKTRYFYERRGGVSASAIDIFTRTFLIRNLYSSGKDKDAIAEADKLIAQYNLRPVAHQVDAAEKQTYLTKDALGNAVYFFSTLSRLRTSTNDLDTFKLLIQYLGMRDDLLPTISLFNETDTDKDLVSRAGTLGVEAANGLLGENGRGLIAAAWVSPAEDKNNAYLVVRGEHPLTLQMEVDSAGLPPPPPPTAGTGTAATHPGKGPRRTQGPQGNSGAGNGGDGDFEHIKADNILPARVLVADKARDAYRRFIERQLSRYSSKEMVLYDFQKDEDGALITIANVPNATPVPGTELPPNVRTVRITAAQLDQIKSSPAGTEGELVRQLLPQSSGTALVAYTNPFALRTTSYKEALNSFVFELERSVAVGHIYRDPLSSKTLANVQALSARPVGRGSDYVAYVDDGSFKVKDFSIIQDIKKTLTSAGIQIVTGIPKSVSVGRTKNVIVITAHSDEQLAAFIDSLGKAGAFKGNYVLLNSCETPLTSDIADRIMQTYGAKATFLHEGLIPASKVQDLMVNLATDIKKQPRRSLVDVFSNAVRQVGLNGVWSVCWYLRGTDMSIQYG